VVQIGTILNDIRKASQTAVEAAEQGREAIEAGRRQIEEAGGTTVTLARSAGQTAEAAAQISASSGQQLAGMEQISQAVGSINVAATQSVAGTRQVESEAKTLQQLAENLKRLALVRGSDSPLDPQSAGVAAA
jgi:methyl-accepting chemotaxis protein